MHTEPTNDDRAMWAREAMNAFARATDMDTAGEDDQSIAGDLLANLMHLAHLDGFDFEAALATARMHFDEEREEE